MRSFALLLIVLAGLCRVDSLVGQQIPAPAISTGEVHQLLRVGEQLEQEERWGEALTHYEDAVRKHPGRHDLEQRLTLVRLHYDVARRYNDHSFLGAVDQLSSREAIDLYGEVLLKIHAHYVEEPDWQSILQRGASSVRVALAKPAFRRQHALTAPEEAFDSLADELYRVSVDQPVASRHDARSLAYHSAVLANQRLGIALQPIILEYACAAAGSLDDYSTFLTANQLGEVLSQIEGSFVGLGVELKAEDHSLLIVTVISGGPAHEGGIVPGDRIIRVNGHWTDQVSTDLAADMLRGEAGSSVDLVVASPDGRQRSLRLLRRQVDVPSVEDVGILDSDHGVAYLRLSTFQKTTARDVEAALWSLHRQGMRSLIVDVRRNPGGLLTAAVEVADKFVTRGALVSTRGRSSGEDFDYKAHVVGTWRVPLVVLIDGDSASASEIFAGAIRDHRRGVIVGSRTYGKGSVQGIFPLNIANAGLRLTTARFYSPTGQAISRRGIDPDVAVRTIAARPIEGTVVDAEARTDSALRTAVNVARRQSRPSRR